MKKTMLTVIIACICVFAAIAIVGCGGSSSSSSASSSESAKSFSSVSESSQVNVEAKPIYVLAVGNDSRYQTAEDENLKADDPSYSDTIMLMRLDPEKNYISILSIPRDTAVDIGGQPEKINAVHQAGGIKALVQYIENMFGVQIPYYFDMKFVDFAALVDKMGGVTVDVPKTITGGDIITDEDITLEAGENTLNGNSALMLVRQRKVYEDNGEAIRQMISRDLVRNAINAFASKVSTEAPNAANLLESYGETNMPENALETYIAAYMDNTGDITYNMGSSPYIGDIDDTGAWRIPADSELYKQIIAAMENGTPLTDLVPNPEVS